MSDRPATRAVLVLTAAAAFYFSANAGHLSLLSFDDCFYAQKGVEMSERGAVFTVTWNGDVTQQHPPLQFWLLSRSFSLFGFNDFAARLPTILMALGLLWVSFEIGHRTVGAFAALVGVALLLLTPTFLHNARRCMLEIPTCFWVSLFFWFYLKGFQRPRWLILLSIPLAAAILTKSVVGFVPLAVVAVGLLWADLRPTRGLSHLALGLALGLLGGASWAIHQGLVHGWEGVYQHYFGEVGRVAGESRALDYFVAYPRMILQGFQPVVIPGLIGAVWVWRRKSPTSVRQARLLALWVLVWLLVASVSSARVTRYVWPILVPLALLGGSMLASWSARVGRAFVVWIAPLLLVAGGIAFWISPHLLTRDLNAPFKNAAESLRAVQPGNDPLPLLGTYSWALASPLMYYGRQSVGAASTSVEESVSKAYALPTPLLLVERKRIPQLQATGLGFREHFELLDWSLVELDAHTFRKPD